MTEKFREEVLDRLYMLHAFTHGDYIIKKNVGLDEEVDTIEWCKKQLKKRSVRAELVGNNWHVFNKKYMLIINSSNLTVISVKRLSK